ncbi:MAG: chemotaxis protein CheW [Alphaproteobacteria bacterium]
MAMPWLMFRTAGHVAALPISHVVETLRALPIESVSGAPPHVIGLSIIRGAPTAIVDTALLFGREPTKHQRTVVVRVGERTIGLAAEEILGARAIGSEALERLPSLFGNVESVSAVTIRDEMLVFVLEAARIISDELLASLLTQGTRA